MIQIELVLLTIKPLRGLNTLGVATGQEQGQKMLDVSYSLTPSASALPLWERYCRAGWTSGLTQYMAALIFSLYASILGLNGP